MRAGFISWTNGRLDYFVFNFILIETLIVISTRFLKFSSVYILSFKLKDLRIPCSFKIHVPTKLLKSFTRFSEHAVKEFLILRTVKN